MNKWATQDFWSKYKFNFASFTRKYKQRASRRSISEIFSTVCAKFIAEEFSLLYCLAEEPTIFISITHVQIEGKQKVLFLCTATLLINKR